jgi:hypothetical protein
MIYSNDLFQWIIPMNYSNDIFQWYIPKIYSNEWPYYKRVPLPKSSWLWIIFTNESFSYVLIESMSLHIIVENNSITHSSRPFNSGLKTIVNYDVWWVWCMIQSIQGTTLKEYFILRNHNWWPVCKDFGSKSSFLSIQMRMPCYHLQKTNHLLDQSWSLSRYSISVMFSLW